MFLFIARYRAKVDTFFVEMFLLKLCILLWKFEIELIQSCNSKSNFKDYEIRGRLSLLVNKDWVSQLTLSFLSPGVLFATHFWQEFYDLTNWHGIQPRINGVNVLQLIGQFKTDWKLINYSNGDLLSETGSRKEFT